MAFFPWFFSLSTLIFKLSFFLNFSSFFNQLINSFYHFLIFIFIVVQSYVSFSFLKILGCSFFWPKYTQNLVYGSLLFTSLIIFFFFFLSLSLPHHQFQVSSNLFSIYFSGAIVTLLACYSLVHLFFQQNDKMEKLT